ncbi:hypothetical protein [Pedobacter cryoconitis]|uniref:hypothetical protein n=1 Tax=Pedobacter cryoconitis TaxID=188932 RepID=UPI0017CA4D9E|nr:hypothetical protein [Pedobacter cryoconitis]MBB5649188.1 hypothetical protein [Pedobacter cryoconitis]
MFGEDVNGGPEDPPVMSVSLRGNPNGDQRGIIRNATVELKRQNPVNAFFVDLAHDVLSGIGVNGFDNKYAELSSKSSVTTKDKLELAYTVFDAVLAISTLPEGGKGGKVSEGGSGVKVEQAYKRPNNATTKAQRASVQGQPCVTCGISEGKMYADHKTPIVVEHYETGKIDKARMRAKESVQPQCPTCSSKQGAEMSRYSKAKKKENGL